MSTPRIATARSPSRSGRYPEGAARAAKARIGGGRSADALSALPCLRAAPGPLAFSVVVSRDAKTPDRFGTLRVSQPVGADKARRLAASQGVALEVVVGDIADWPWPEAAYDAVAAIFIQFAPPALRDRIFAGIRRSLKPGGLALVHGYTPKQLEFRTGGPSVLEQFYTEAMLREAFAGFEILELRSYEDVLDEGTAHSGPSALIDLVARKPRA